MKLIIAVSEPTVVLVRVTFWAFTILVMELIAGFVDVLFGPQPMAAVNTTGVNFGSEEVGSPPSGASMIHSQVLPLKSAPGGGARVMEKCTPVVLLTNVIVAETCAEYWTVQETDWPGATGMFGMPT
jgi:hypothetical protein